MQTFGNSSFGARANVFIKGVRVQTQHLGYKKTVKGLSNKTAKTHIFEAAEFGGRISVEDYFKRSMDQLTCFRQYVNSFISYRV